MFKPIEILHTIIKTENGFKLDLNEHSFNRNPI